VLAAAGAGQAAQYLARPMTSYRLLALGAGPRQIGFVAAAFAVVPVFLAIPLGRFTDRRRSESLVVAGSTLLAIACVGLAFGTTVWWLAAASIVLGIGHLSLMLGVQNAITLESHADQHDARFGLFTAVVSLGQLVGPHGGAAKHIDDLGCDGAVGSTCEIVDGVYTGKALDPCFGAYKATALRELAQREGIDLARSTAYSDSHTDLAFLEAVGNPVAVNPDKKLRTIARERNWPVLHFNQHRLKPDFLRRAPNGRRPQSVHEHEPEESP